MKGETMTKEEDIERVLSEYTLEHGPNRGFVIEDIHYVQGEGVCWEGHIDSVKFIDANLMWSDPDYTKVQLLRELLQNDPCNDTLNVTLFIGAPCTPAAMNVSDIDMDFDGGLTVAGPLTTGAMAGADGRTLYEAIDGGALCKQLSAWIKEEAKGMAVLIFRLLEDNNEME